MDKVRILIILLGLSFNTFAADVSDIEQWALKKSPDLKVSTSKTKRIFLIFGLKFKDRAP